MASKIEISPLFTNLLAIILFIFAITSYLFFGLYGIDFGLHWDEGKLLQSVNQTALTGIILPRWYHYPSLTYFFTILSTLVYIIYDLLLDLKNINSINDLKLFLQLSLSSNQSILIFIRSVFFSLGLLSTFFIFLSCRLIQIRFSISLIIASLFITSFQFFYHSRWISPDTLLVLTASLTLFVALRTIFVNSTKWLIILNICVGLMISAKYTGGFFILIPLYLSNINGFSLKNNLFIFLIVSFCFFVITPGAIIEPIRFARDVWIEINHYKNAGHGIYTIQPGIYHLQRIFDFLSFRAFSYNPYVSFTLYFLTLIGAYFLFRINKVLFVVLFSIPILYLIYFSTNRVMIVRNLLIVLPFFFVLCGYAFERIAHLYVKFYAEILIIMTGFIFVFMSVLEIRNTTLSLFTTDKMIKEQLSSYMNSRKGESVLISKRALGYMDPYIHTKLKQYQGQKIDKVIFILGEFNKPKERYLSQPFLGELANVRGIYSVIAGPNEIDIDYYPSWSGKSRVIELSGEKASLFIKINENEIFALFQ
jgi:hypothetical protein